MVSQKLLPKSPFRTHWRHFQCSHPDLHFQVADIIRRVNFSLRCKQHHSVTQCWELPLIFTSHDVTLRKEKLSWKGNIMKICLSIRAYLARASHFVVYAVNLDWICPFPPREKRLETELVKYDWSAPDNKAHIQGRVWPGGNIQSVKAHVLPPYPPRMSQARWRHPIRKAPP